MTAAERRHAPVRLPGAAALTPKPSPVGAFYSDIIAELERTAREEPDLFCGDHSRQITGAFYYAGGG